MIQETLVFLCWEILRIYFRRKAKMAIQCREKYSFLIRYFPFILATQWDFHKATICPCFQCKQDRPAFLKKTNKHVFEACFCSMRSRACEREMLRLLFCILFINVPSPALEDYMHCDIRMSKYWPIKGQTIEAEAGQQVICCSWITVFITKPESATRCFLPFVLCDRRQNWQERRETEREGELC